MINPELMQDLREQIRTDIRAGFEGPDAICAMAIDTFAADADADELQMIARALVKQELAARQHLEAEWPDVTDCDMLDAAFAALEVKGIVCRQHFTCCGTCGSTEIWDEIDAAEQAGRAVRGYAFYHQQDTESAVEGYGLYLNYGAVAQGEEAAIAIGHELVQQLEASGLTTDWNGRLDRRIAVTLDWKRRHQAATASPLAQ